MGKNNLPIKIVLQKAEDIFPNHGGGESKFFGEVTPFKTFPFVSTGTIRPLAL